MSTIRYDDTGFDADTFLVLAQRVWPKNYDHAMVSEALKRTLNIGAWDEARLVGAVRLLTDGYLFATVPEILVDPDYRRRGIGRELMAQAVSHAPRRKLFLGAQPEAVTFFERIGCRRGLLGFTAEQGP
jgi:ribosomal protein S18 acetylase RimI-like enzyme